MITAVPIQEIERLLIKQIDNMFGLSNQDKLMINSILHMGGKTLGIVFCTQSK